MKKLWPAIVLFFFVFFACRLLFIQIGPQVIMGFVVYKGASEFGWNRFAHVERISHKSRQVVGPSPDLLYSGCAFDVSERPLSLSIESVDSYWSLSAYADNTDNFFTMNDRKLIGTNLQVVLFGPDQKQPPAMDGVLFIRSPSNTGILIARFLITSEDRFPFIDQKRRKARCWQDI